MARGNQTELKPIKAPLFARLTKEPAHIVAPLLMVGLSAAALIAIGLVMVYSSSSFTSLIEKGDASFEAFKQVIFAVIGIVFAFILVKFVHEDLLMGAGSWLAWIISMFLVFATIVSGASALGAQRWLIIGGVSIQASEIAKIAFVLMAARIITRYVNGELTLKDTLLGLLLLVVAPLALILFTQSDLGTTMICGVALLVMLWISGLDARLMLAVVVVVVALGFTLIFTSSYRAARFFSFTDPWSDSTDTGYQLIHGLQALAYGGFFGGGIGNSYEKMAYLPEAETDFIFSIIGEEMGFVGAMFVVALFGILLVGSFMIARNSESMFGRLVAGSLGAMLVFQAFLNILCNIGLAPITGKPLPFISSGGSSMISSCVCVGIILAIGFDTRRASSESARRRENLRVVSAQRPSTVHGSANSRYSNEHDRNRSSVPAYSAGAQASATRNPLGRSPGGGHVASGRGFQVQVLPRR